MTTRMSDVSFRTQCRHRLAPLAHLFYIQVMLCLYFNLFNCFYSFISLITPSGTFG